MSRRWVVPAYQVSTWLIYLSGNNFNKGEFKLKFYLFHVLLVALGLVRTLLALTKAVTEGDNTLKLVVDLIILSYEGLLLIQFAAVHEEMADLMRCLAKDLSNYTSYQINSEMEGGRIIQERMRTTERFILSNYLKVICSFAIYPLFYAQKDIQFLHEYLSLILGSSTEFFLSLCNFLFNFSIAISVGVYHANWEIIMVDSISRLTGELTILADSINTIDQRARNMFEVLRREIEISCCPWRLKARGTQQQITFDEMMKEGCLFECLKESIRHHQAIIKTTQKLNRATGMCTLIYLQTIGITVGVCLFMIAQTDHLISPRALLYCLILFPTMMSQGVVCVFGQELLDKSEDLCDSMYTSHWQTRSKRYISCLRIMMLRCQTPLCLRSPINVVNKSNYVEFLKAGYSFLNFLLTMNSSKQRSGEFGNV